MTWSRVAERIKVGGGDCRDGGFLEKFGGGFKEDMKRKNGRNEEDKTMENEEDGWFIRDLFNGDVSFLDIVPKEMVTNFDKFRPRVLHRVFAKVNHAFVVVHDRKVIESNVVVDKSLFHPQCLLTCLSFNHVIFRRDLFNGDVSFLDIVPKEMVTNFDKFRPRVLHRVFAK
nr:hypothetical protein [Tanacetum cinerariifolium]